LTASQ
jgi:hypothetical protein